MNSPCRTWLTGLISPVGQVLQAFLSQKVSKRATARADAPGGGEADAERLAAVIEALTGKRPRIYHKKNGAIVIACGRRHLEGFRRFAELADAASRGPGEAGGQGAAPGGGAPPNSREARLRRGDQPFFLQVLPRRFFLTGIIIPVSQYLQVCGSFNSNTATQTCRR